MKNYNQNLKDIFNYYGEENQKQQLIQEMADVQVMIDQFTLIYPDLFQKLVETKHYKAERQIKRIFGSKE